MYSKSTKLIFKNTKQGGEKMKRYSKLIGIRNQCGLSQRETGAVLGITAQAYNAKENGRTVFTADDMAKIRDVLSDKLGQPLTIDELFF